MCPMTRSPQAQSWCPAVSHQALEWLLPSARAGLGAAPSFSHHKALEGAVGSVALYLGLQRAYLCLSQYGMDCLGKERMQTPDSVPPNARKRWGRKSLEKKKIIIRVSWNLQEKCGAQEQNPKRETNWMDSLSCVGAAGNGTGEGLQGEDPEMCVQPIPALPPFPKCSFPNPAQRAPRAPGGLKGEQEKQQGLSRATIRQHLPPTPRPLGCFWGPGDPEYPCGASPALKQPQQSLHHHTLLTGFPPRQPRNALRDSS